MPHRIYILLLFIGVVFVSKTTSVYLYDRAVDYNSQIAQVITIDNRARGSFWNKIIDIFSEPLVPLFISEIVPVDTDLSTVKNKQQTAKKMEDPSFKPVSRSDLGKRVRDGLYANIVNNYYYGLSRTRIENIIDTKLGSSKNSIKSHQIQVLENSLREYVNTTVQRQADGILNGLSRMTNVTTITGSSGATFSESVSGLDYSSGVLSLTAGYEIPTTASTSDWTSKVSSQWGGSSGSNIFYTSGNVGIGTSSPAYKLTVNGDISLTGALRASDGSGTAGMVLQTTGSGVQWVATSSLGITGSSSSNYLTLGSGYLATATTTDGLRAGYFQGISTTTFQFRSQYDSSNHFSIQTNSTGLTSLTAAGTATGVALLGGNVGIATTSTSSKLTIQGELGVDSFTVASSTGISTLKLTSAGNLGLGYGASASALLHVYAASAPYMKFANNTTGQLSTDGFDIGLDSSGNVELRQREALETRFFTNNVQRMVLSSGGLFGLGVTSPQAKLHVDAGAGTTYIKITNTNTGTAVGDGIDIGIDASGNAEFRLRENGEMKFYTNTSQRMVITGGDTTTGGNVGIGTTSPTVRLAVKGIGGSSKSFTLTNSTDVEKFVIYSNGNTGILNSTPQALLHVGNSSANNSSDSQILISRAVDDTVVGNGHAFSDSSAINRSGTIGYNSYDARITFSGTNDYDHYAAFQAIPTYSSSGLMANYYGLYTRIDTTAGTITNSYGTYVANPTGLGAVTNNYGLYIEALGKGVTENFAIYTEGTTKSYFGGNVGIGTTTPGQKLVVVGNARITGVTSGAYASDLNLTADGTLTTSASDIRLKENLVAISTSTLDKLTQLKAYSFNWITDPTHRTDIGLIAQDVEMLFPELVFTNKSDGYKGVNYSRLAVLAIEGLQEQQKLIGAYTVDVSTQAIQTIIDGAKNEVARNPIVYIGDRALQGIRTLTDLVAVRITAVRGYFSELFTKEITTEKLCVTKSNGVKVCLNGDQLESLLNQADGVSNVQSNQIIPQQVPSGEVNADTTTDSAESTAEETINTNTQESTDTGTVSENGSPSTDADVTTVETSTTGVDSSSVPTTE